MNEILQDGGFMINVIIIDDDFLLRKTMKTLLEGSGFAVFCFSSAEQFLLSKPSADEYIYIVDAGLPGLLGHDVIRTIRYRDKISPIFMISGDADRDNINRGLLSGADDFLVKPFDPEMFIAKMINAQKKTLLILNRLKDLEVSRDASTLTVMRNGASVKLTSTQFKILSFIMDADQKKSSREDLVSGSDNPEITSRTIDVHIHGMRKKLQDIGISLRSIRGFGYQVSYL